MLSGAVVAVRLCEVRLCGVVAGELYRQHRYLSSTQRGLVALSRRGAVRVW